MSVKAVVVALGAGLPLARHRNVTAWARVQLPLGEKVVAEVPVVMPLSTAQLTASKKKSSFFTSTNLLSGVVGSVGWLGLEG